MAGWFWLGAGNSPDTGGSPPSSIVPWCLGGPGDDGNWPLARTERMVASSNAVAAASPQNSHEYSGKGRSRWARAMKRAAISIAAGAKKKKTGNKTLFKTGGKQNREEMAQR